MLLRWQAGVYGGLGAASPSYDAMCRLFERGLGVDVERDDGPCGPGLYATVTPVGELALRCDAAARVAGVWSC